VRVTLAAAAAMLALGLLLIFRPNDSLVAAAVLIGIALLVTGLLRLLRAVTAGGRAGAHRGSHVLTGILAALAGCYCLGNISMTAVMLSLVAGLFLVMHGLVDLVAASSAGQGRRLARATGVLGLLAGLTMIFWPAITLPVVAAVMGAWLACNAVLLAVAALYQRRFTRVPAKAAS